MLKNILNLEGTQKLTKNEQKEINGGKPAPIGCGEGGFNSGIHSCLCSRGLYDTTAEACVEGISYNTGRYFESATNCCYAF